MWAIGAFVHVKLIVISEDQNVNELASKISKSSNSQNAVKDSDFSVSEQFNTKMQELSRAIKIPNDKGEISYWFYERIRGQYEEEQARNTRKERGNTMRIGILGYGNLGRGVENAVKHGITKKENGGTIHISSRAVEQGYEVIIDDDGVGYKPSDDDKIHTGISNVSGRLKSMSDGTLSISNRAEGGTHVVIFIPAEHYTKSPKKAGK